MEKPNPFDADRIRRSFDAALAMWGVNLNLSPPEPFDAGKKEKWGGDDPLAYIDLIKRQVVVNYMRLADLGAAGALTAVLAHEVGHHARFPHSMRLVADLNVIEKRLVPLLNGSLTNLFFDLLVNEFVGRSLDKQLVDVYKGFASKGGGPMTPLFAFYLAVYEELWDLGAGALIGKEEEALEERFEGFRAEARLFAQTFFDLDDVYLQFAYFIGRFIRYLDKPQNPMIMIPLAGDLPEPSVDDYDGALLPNPRADGALKEAAERGWIDKGKAAGEDPLDTIGRLTGAGHGRGAAAFRRALVDRHYRRLIDRHIIDIPPGDPLGGPEPSIPTSVSPWEAGEDPRSIDWNQSVLSHGELAGAMPLKRDLEPDDDPSASTDVPPIEIYLDTSGSMPDPASRLNAMTLAAQVLSASAIRKGGKVRAVIYSDGEPMISDWFRDEAAARAFLFNYAGGGTYFPFDALLRLAEDEPAAVRVIVSDSGFFYDLNRPEAGPAVEAASKRSRLLAAMLLLWGGFSELPKHVEPIAASGAVKFVFVEDSSQLAAAAASLGKAIFGD